MTFEHPFRQLPVDWKLTLNIIILFFYYIQMADVISTGPFTLTPSIKPSTSPKDKCKGWAKNDILKYGIFVYYFHQQRLFPRLACNKWPFYRRLSIFLQRKNPNQCRILHMAMLQKHHTIQQIIQCFITKNHNFLSVCQKVEPTIKNIIHIIAKEQSAKGLLSSASKTNKRCQQVVEQIGIGSEKEKEQLKPTDINYPEEVEDVVSGRNTPLNRQGRSWLSQQESGQKQSKVRAVAECQWGFTEYLHKLSTFAPAYLTGSD